MSRVCAVTGRRTRVGHQVTRRGLAKKQGGVGRRVTGRSKRKFKPNIHTIRVLTPDGGLLRLKVSTKVIKTGVIKLKQQNGKTKSFPLVKALRGRNRAHSKAQKGWAGSACYAFGHTPDAPCSLSPHAPRDLRLDTRILFRVRDPDVWTARQPPARSLPS